MIRPASLDLSVWRNADLATTVTFTAAGAAVNIAGYTFEMQIRARPKDATAIVDLVLDVSGDRLQITNAAGGELYVFVSKDTLDLIAYSGGVEADEFYYDLRGRPGGGAWAVYLTGKIKLNPGVTR